MRRPSVGSGSAIRWAVLRRDLSNGLCVRSGVLPLRHYLQTVPSPYHRLLSAHLSLARAICPPYTSIGSIQGPQRPPRQCRGPLLKSCARLVRLLSAMLELVEVGGCVSRLKSRASMSGGGMLIRSRLARRGGGRDGWEMSVSCGARKAIRQDEDGDGRSSASGTSRYDFSRRRRGVKMVGPSRGIERNG